jgi:hypothetical protein
MEAIQIFIPGANVKKMVRSFPEILELTPGMRCPASNK